MDLRSKKCIPCEGDTPPLMANEIKELRTQVPEWEIKDWHELHRKFKFKNFAEALAFVNKVGALAEHEGHHPDITFGWGYVEITTFTHVIDGLSENDFILAVKIDALIQSSILNRLNRGFTTHPRSPEHFEEQNVSEEKD